MSAAAGDQRTPAIADHAAQNGSAPDGGSRRKRQVFLREGGGDVKSKSPRNVRSGTPGMASPWIGLPYCAGASGSAGSCPFS